MVYTCNNTISLRQKHLTLFTILVKRTSDGLHNRQIDSQYHVHLFISCFHFLQKCDTVTLWESVRHKMGDTLVIDRLYKLNISCSRYKSCKKKKKFWCHYKDIVIGWEEFLQLVTIMVKVKELSKVTEPYQRPYTSLSVQLV